MGLRFEGFITTQCLINTIPPVLPDAYREAGIPTAPTREVRMAADCLGDRPMQTEKMMNVIGGPK